MEIVGEDDSETGSVTKKKGNQKSTTGIGASLTTGFRIKRRATTTSTPYNGTHR